MCNQIRRLNHSRKELNLIFLLVLVMVCFMGGQAVSAAEREPGNNPSAADVMLTSDGIYFAPKLGYGHLVITVSAPNGEVFRKSFDSGSSPYLELTEICENQVIDGSYTYELRISQAVKNKVRGEAGDFSLTAGRKSQRAITQTGYFTVRGGSIIVPVNRPEPKGNLSRPEQTINEDVYVVGSLCVGADCADPETWLYDIIRLKESNIRIHFDDTSSTSAYPANDWRILINDTADGGANYFAVEDSTADAVPFKIEAGAPENALYIEDYGRIGINTSTPAADLHIVDGDSPCTRLEQDTSGGFSAQTWEVGGNESYFFIRDVSNGTNVPFMIQPAAPSNTLCLKADGKVGIGTWSPGYAMELQTTGTNAEFVAQRSSASACYISGGLNYGFFGTKTNHPLRIAVNGSWKMEINGSGHYINMTDGGYYDGTWHDSSSRSVKEDIRSLDTDEAKEALTGLNPVKFRYKNNKEEEHVGFIAEEVPELVATKDRKAMSPMDVVGVLTKIVQEQQKIIQDQQQFVQEQLKINSELQKRIEKLENQ